MPLRTPAETVSGAPESPREWRRARPEFVGAAHAAGLANLDALSDRGLGTAVTSHRSSWVRRTRIGIFELFIKTYDYPTRRDRVRGGLRNTWLRRSRAAAEWAALEWLRDRDLGAPRPLAWLERRRLGWLHRAVLVTEALPGRPLDQLLPELPADERDQLLLELERGIEQLHEAGFRHRNLDLRNLLAQRTSDGGDWQLAFLDAPRHRLVAAGVARDRLAQEDWRRLHRSLAALGLGGRS